MVDEQVAVEHGTVSHTILYTDEIAKMQQRIGCILPLASTHGTQNVQGLGLGQVYSLETVPDYVSMYNYLSDCTLAVLDEVSVDSLILTKIVPGQTYAIKNKYQPFFQWHGTGSLSVMPPVFGREHATVKLESNDVDIVFPMVLPTPIAEEVLQKILLFNVYSRVVMQAPGNADMLDVHMHLGSVSYLGHHYELALPEVPGPLGLALLDNLSLYFCIMVTLLPRASMRLVRGLIRHEHHDLLNLFQEMVPDEIARIDLDDLSVADDLSRMRVMMTYLQSLASLFNLGPRLATAAYSQECMCTSSMSAFPGACMTTREYTLNRRIFCSTSSAMGVGSTMGKTMSTSLDSGECLLQKAAGLLQKHVSASNHYKLHLCVAGGWVPSKSLAVLVDHVVEPPVVAQKLLLVEKCPAGAVEAWPSGDRRSCT